MSPRLPPRPRPRPRRRPPPTDAVDEIPSEELQVAVGPFRGLDGYSVMPRPTGSRADWAAALAGFSWTGKRVAHIFPDKWATASFRRKPKADEIAEYGDGFYVFYYGDVKEEMMHDLDLDEWGITKSWVILEKVATPTTARAARLQKRSGAGGR